MLHQGVDVSEFVVIECQIGFHGGILEKFVARVFVVLLFQISQAQVEMNESQPRIRLGRSLEIGQGKIVLFEIQVRLAHEQMEFGRAFADLNQLRRGLIQFFLPARWAAIESTYR